MFPNPGLPFDSLFLRGFNAMILLNFSKGASMDPICCSNDIFSTSVSFTYYFTGLLFSFFAHIPDNPVHFGMSEQEDHPYGTSLFLQLVDYFAVLPRGLLKISRVNPFRSGFCVTMAPEIPVRDHVHELIKLGDADTYHL